MFKVILLIAALNLGSAFEIAPVERNADEMCVRLDGKPGYCIYYKNCSTIFRLFEQNKQGIQLMPQEKDYIRKSRCPIYKKGYVCCESEDIISKGIQELSTHQCGIFKIPKVVGGRRVKLMSRPWMALLNFRTKFNTTEFTCGGSLINKRFILTAAHCFNNQDLLSVRLGEHNITSDIDCDIYKGKRVCSPTVEDIGVERVFIHENYSSGTGHNDIALVKLNRDVDTSQNNIKSICLPFTEVLHQEGENISNFRVAGWGRTESGQGSDVLMESIINGVKRETCQSSYTREIVLTQMCSGDFGKDSCNGDSGGPLAYPALVNRQQRFVQFGIVSFGSAQCGDGNPGVYTRVGSYISWIAYKLTTK